MNRLHLLALFLFPLTAAAQTQPEPGIGLSGSLQSGQFDVSVPVWTSPSFAVVPSVGFDYAQDVGTDTRLGLAFRVYQRVATVAPYAVVRGGVLLFSPTQPEDGPELDSALDVLVGVGYGAEAFLLPQLSLGVEAQVNATFSAEESGRFGNPGGTNVNTAAAVTATVYF